MENKTRSVLIVHITQENITDNGIALKTEIVADIKKVFLDDGLENNWAKAGAQRMIDQASLHGRRWIDEQNYADEVAEEEAKAAENES